MKTIKWILTGIALALLTVATVKGTFADTTPDSTNFQIEQCIYQRITQSDSLTTTDNITEFVDNKKLLPVAFEGRPIYAATPQSWSTNSSDYLYSDKVGNVIDEFVMVKNTGDTTAYVRTWFAFEMGDLTAEEFQASVAINRNTTAWTWSEFDYTATIDRQRYAIVHATYNSALTSGSTTSNPSLLQIMLCNTVTNDISKRLDGNSDDKYDVKVFTRAVSDKRAFGDSELTNHPWNTYSNTLP